MMQTKVTTVLLLAALVSATSAHAADIRPGLWAFRSTHLSLGGLPDMSSQIQQQLQALPPETRRMLEREMAARGARMGGNGTVQSCITAEQARQDTVYSGKVEGNCVLSQVNKTPGRVTGRLDCTQPAATGRFTANIASPQHFTTRVDIRSAQGDMQIETEARWLSAQCGAVR